jgi:hypothetical protein
MVAATVLQAKLWIYSRLGGIVLSYFTPHRDPTMK